MLADTIDRLNHEFQEFPIMRAVDVPSISEVENASREIGVPFSLDYQEFLIRFGGAMVGAYPIYGLRPVDVMGNQWSVVDVTHQYRRNQVPGCQSWAVISGDHAGNPIGMNSDGAIWMHDHDFGGTVMLAQTFELYIRVHCLHLPK